MPPPPEPRCLRESLDTLPDHTLLWTAGEIRVEAGQLRALLAEERDQINRLAGRRVALWAASALDLAFLLVALDGIAEGLLLLPSDLQPEQVAAFARRAAADYLVLTGTRRRTGEQIAADVPYVDLTPDWGSVGHQGAISPGTPLAIGPLPQLLSEVQADAPATRWIIPTSGTTGTPKLVGHTLGTLTRTARPGSGMPHRWGLLYDLARFAGLQVFFQAFLSRSPLIFTDHVRGLEAQVAALAAAGCTALSATPTLWRKILMSGAHEVLRLQQVTLGGEIADAAVLAALAQAYPGARITHIYASTEAGVGFSVQDRRAGFPVDYEAHPPQGISIRVDEAGVLWLRPERLGQSFVDGAEVLANDEGWINTGDLVQRQGDRYLFLGRASGAINVGGNKVFPEEVERIVCEAPGVALAMVKARRSSITGALVEAIVVPADLIVDRKVLAREVQRYCRERLPAYKVPAIVTVSDVLEMASTGKIMRSEP